MEVSTYSTVDSPRKITLPCCAVKDLMVINFFMTQLSAYYLIHP